MEGQRFSISWVVFLLSAELGVGNERDLLEGSGLLLEEDEFLDVGGEGRSLVRKHGRDH